MSVDSSETEWHLTPQGWVAGTSRFYGKPDKDGEIEPPQDRVETWVSKTYQRSAWSSEERTWRRIWFDANLPEEDRNALRAKFPPGWRSA